MISRISKHPEWQVILDLFRELPYGESLPHGVIAAAAKLQAQSPVYYRHTKKARDVALRDHGIEIETLTNEGYRRVEPGRYGERARRNVRLGMHRVKRGRTVIEVAPLETLTPQQIKDLSDAAAKIGALIALGKSALRSMQKLLPPARPTMPKLFPAAEDADEKQPQ